MPCGLSDTFFLQDKFRVLSCSKDFSIRVYSWNKTPTCSVSGAEASAPISREKDGAKKGEWSGTKLESRYTLLGGSVALKTQYVVGCYSL